METPEHAPALRRLGYRPAFHDRFRQACDELARADLEPARVIAERGPMRRIAHRGGESEAVTRANLRPAVGDWVAAAVPGDQQAASIVAVLGRETLLSRRAVGGAETEQVIAANLDVVFIVMGVDGDYNLRRLERYLVTIAESGAQPVVVLTKSDLSPDPGAARVDAQLVAPGVPVHAISARDGVGLDALAPFLAPGTTVALVGSSGAGKSTLLNTLAGAEVMATGAVRPGDSHGRHTTTQRRLAVLPTGALVVDTPGLREIQLWVDEQSLDSAFPEIDRLAAGCRFRDCGHLDEPGCAVTAAVSEGALDPARLASWHKLRDEIASSDRRRNVAARRADERRLTRTYREAQADRRRRRR